MPNDDATSRTNQNRATPRPDARPIDSTAWSDGDLERALEAIERGGRADGFADAEARALGAMARDRDALRALAASDGSAPPGLLTGAIDAALDDAWDSDVIERLAHDDAADSPLPVSAVVPEREGVVGWLLRHRTETGLALAAVLAIAVGGAALVSMIGPAEPERLAVGPTPSGGPEGLDWSRAVIEGGTIGEPEPAVIAEAPTPDGPADVLGPKLALASFGVPVESVFDGADLMLERRLLVVVRGSGERTAEVIESMLRREVGLDHSYAMLGAMDESALEALALPEIDTPVMAMDTSSGVVRVALPERSGWTGEVRPTANGLASLIDGFRDAGLSVEMRAMPEAADAIDATDGAATGDGTVRAVPIPVIFETLR
jgi:hypothetical protein